LAEADTPGCIAVALVTETVQMKFACTPGAGPMKLDQHSLFEIGSITKGFTGLLLADMVRKGEVSLDDPVSKHARAGATLPKRGEEEITLRDLVTQTSGLPRMPPGFKPANPADPFADYTADALYEALAVTKLHVQKERYEYSNFGFMWLSEVLARRGKSYEALLKERVLLPLEMTDTGATLTPEQEKRFVVGHDGRTRKFLTGTTDESRGGRHAEIVARRHGEARAGDDRKARDIAEGIDRARRRADAALRRAELDRLRLGHEPARRNDGAMAQRRHRRLPLDHCDERRTREAAIVLVDSTTPFDDLGVHLVDPDFPLSKKRIGLPTDIDTLKQYAGRYELTPTFAIEVFVEGNKLVAQATAQSAFEVLREGPDAFFYTVVPAKLRFSRAANGEVDSMTLEQEGRELKGKRAPSTR